MGALFYIAMLAECGAAIGAILYVLAEVAP